MTLNNCTFEGNNIKKNFLSDLSTKNFKIHSLEIYASNVGSITAFAFNSSVFIDYLTSLNIDNNRRNRVDDDDEFKFLLDTRDSFYGLTVLTSLMLKNNPFIEIYDSPLTCLTALTHLSIQNTAETWDLAKLYTNTILINIVSLNIGNNNFPSLDASCFSGVSKNVKTLSIPRSNIYSIDSETFNDFENLQSLNLQRNKLFYLPGDIFVKILYPVGVVESIEVRGNEWLCNCQLEGFQSTLIDFQDIFDEPVCFSSGPYFDKTIIEVDLCATPETTNDDISSDTVELCDEDNDDCSEETTKTLHGTTKSDEILCENDEESECETEEETTSEATTEETVDPPFGKIKIY